MGVRGLIAVILCILMTVNAAEFGSNLKSRDLGLADVPPCGLLCLISTVPGTGCDMTDLNCTCRNAHLARTLSACMLANCTMADSSRAAKVQAALCNLSNESKTTEVYLYTAIVYVIAFLFVTLRIIGKFMSNRLALDDGIVVLALLLTAVPLGCIFAMTKIGFGQHLWNLDEGALRPILRYFLISSSAYVVVLGLIKISLILFYLQIFKTHRFVKWAYAVLGYIIINIIIIFFMTLFSCQPIQSFWNRDIKGKCLDIQALAYANSASAIFQDLILLILPVIFIKNIKLKRYRKLAVGLMFSIGSFGCIATILRLQTLLAFKISIDPTWDYVPVTIWTELELAAGFICVSLPSIRVLVVKIVPEKIKAFFSQITNSSTKESSAQKQIIAPQQREWKRPNSWMNISPEAGESAIRTEARKSFMGRLWARASGKNHSTPTKRDSNDVQNQPMELLAIPNSPANGSIRQSWNTSRSQGDHAEGLPAIGCLPEGNFSDLDLTRGPRQDNRKQSVADRV